MLNFKMWPLEDLEKKLVSCFFFTHKSAKSSFQSLNISGSLHFMVGRLDGCCASFSAAKSRSLCLSACTVRVDYPDPDPGQREYAVALWQYFPQLPSQSCTELAEWRRSILNLLALHFRFWWSVPLQLQFMTQLQSSLQWQISPLLLHCTKKKHFMNPLYSPTWRFPYKNNLSGVFSYISPLVVPYPLSIDTAFPLKVQTSSAPSGISIACCRCLGSHERCKILSWRISFHSS